MTNKNMSHQPTSGKDLLRIEDLHVSIPIPGGNVRAVKGASLRVLPGKVTALVGESGSGKSVISQVIMGLAPEQANVTGRVLFNDPEGSGEDLDLVQLPRDGRMIRSIRGRRIGMIFQEPMTSFSPLHTVGDQICEVLRIHTNLSVKEQRQRCEEMLSLVGFDNPASVFDMYSFELSGGMRQRTMIAMALVCEPALLIADEPTTALDVTIQAQILKLLRELQSRLGMAILLITHDLGVVANMADEVSVIYHGEIMEAGPLEPLFNSPRHPYLKGLMSAIPHFGMPRDTRLKPLREIETHAEHLIDKLVAPPKNPIEAAPDVILSVKNLSKTFITKKQDWQVGGSDKPVPAVDGVSFDIRRGECLGLVGESGCGKSTLSKILMHAISPDTGSVMFDDGSGPVNVLQAAGEQLQELRTKVQLIFQDPISSLSPRMTVGNILREPFEIHGRGNKEQRNIATMALLDAVGLGVDALQRYPHSFSGGQRQRVGISRALAVAPSLIICDEPVSALDVSVQAQILNLLKDLQKDMGLTYLFISHNLAVIDYMADRVAVMWAGKIVEMAPRDVIMNSPVHPYTKALMSAVPYPDLARPLDFSAAGVSSTESQQWWPEIFQSDGGQHALSSIDLGNEHFVLARSTAERSELKP
ncbi:dipeptide ABC transporter ATP-binding protein [Granulosicoccus antarcticus]|uniref:Glutathione import ATP-binding protein GsiA n=1 Tax=Granulosicoccus antarcticus IMCC3135 TaxID=1192854 RepID=A0A2Z2P3F4_9GAMM|nr:ABC transporter ATP-binding protein [Granulosicoccus antarcticus]ASJ75960.1 Glutathione import ATP-binding protein GsiA [Granulosicoccus antarcticus IMCC3135]